MKSKKDKLSKNDKGKDLAKESFIFLYKKIILYSEYQICSFRIAAY
jgi:hypothetical protein